MKKKLACHQPNQKEKFTKDDPQKYELKKTINTLDFVDLLILKILIFNIIKNNINKIIPIIPVSSSNSIIKLCG